MARSPKPDAGLTPYLVTGDSPFHHPDGVALPSAVLMLSPEAAERGLATGRLVPHADAAEAPGANQE